MVYQIQKIWDSIDSQRFYTIAGHILGAFFIVFSIWYYKERLFHIDAAYYTFRILNDETFFMPHSRYINYVNQWLPLLFMKLGASYKAILIAYSFSFALFYYVVFLIVNYLFRNPRAALFMFVALLMTCRYKHFMAVTETTITMATSFLFIGWVTGPLVRRNYRLVDYFVALLVSLPLLVGHPIIFVALLSFGAFHICYRKEILNYKAWGVVLIVILLFILRYKVLSFSGYESNKMNVLYNYKEVLSTFGEQVTWNHMRGYFKSKFMVAMTAYIISLIYLLYNRKVLSFLVSVISVVLFSILIVVVYPKGNALNMLESYYIFIGYLWTIPILYVIKDAPKFYNLKIALLSILILYGGYKLWRHGNWFGERVEHIKSLVKIAEDNNTSKLFYPQRWCNWGLVGAPWAFAFESLLYSTVVDPEHSRTVYLYNTQNMDKYDLSDSTLFLGPQYDPLKFKNKQLPGYFTLKKEPYYKVRLNN